MQVPNLNNGLQKQAGVVLVFELPGSLATALQRLLNIILEMCWSFQGLLVLADLGLHALGSGLLQLVYLLLLWWPWTCHK